MGGLIMRRLLCRGTENKRGNKLIFVSCVLLFSISLLGCDKVSDEKVKICKDLYNDVIEKHNDTIEAYSSISSNEFDIQLNTFQEELSSIGEYNINEIDDKSIDSLISDLEVRLIKYDELLSEFDLLNSGSEYTEMQNNLSATIVNSTGLDLYEVYFYDITKEKDRVNLLSDSIEMLSGYGIFSIVNMCFDNQNTIWKLEVMDEAGNIIESQEIDLKDYKSNITINMEFSFDTMEGWLEIN